MILFNIIQAQTNISQDGFVVKSYEKFTGGMVTAAPANKLTDDQFSLLENLLYNTQGRLIKRKGFRLFSQTSDTLGKSGGGLVRYYPTGDTSQLLFFVDTAMWKANGSEPALTKETSRFFKYPADYFFAQSGSKLYCVNGRDTNFVWDFTSDNFGNWGIVDSGQISAFVPDSVTSRNLDNPSIVADAYVRRVFISGNFGRWNTCGIALTDSVFQGVDTAYAYLKFDLSNFIVGDSLSSVICSLYVGDENDTVNVDWYIKRITATWNEYTIDWSGKPTVGTINYDTASITGTGWIVFDLTAITDTLVNGTYPNYGFRIEAAAHSNIKYFNSRENSTNRPRVNAVLVDPLTAYEQNPYKLIDSTKAWEIDQYQNLYVLLLSDSLSTKGDYLRKILLNKAETLYVEIPWSEPTFTGAGDQKYRIVSLPISDDRRDTANNIDTFSVDSVTTYNPNDSLRKVWVTKTGLTAGDYKNKPFFAQVTSGRGNGFYQVLNNFDTASTDYLLMRLPSVLTFDNTTRFKVYKVQPLTSTFIESYKNRFFYGINRGPDFLNYLFFSDFSRPDIVKASMFLDLDTKDGDVITGLASQFATGYADPLSALNVFKNTHIFEIYFQSDASIVPVFTILEVTNQLGCIAARSLARFQNSLIFLSKLGVYAKTPQGFDYLSAGVQDILDKIDRKFINRCAGTMVGYDYFLSYPNPDNGDTINTAILIYSFITKSWTKANIGAGLWATTPLPTFKSARSFKPHVGSMIAGFGSPSPSDTFNVLFTDTKKDSIYTYGFATTDTGANITATIQTKKEDFDLPNYEKRIREAYIEFKKTDGSNLITQIFNNYSATPLFADTTAVTDTTIRRIDFPSDAVNKLLTFKMTTTDVGFELLSWMVKYEPMRRRIKP